MVLILLKGFIAYMNQRINNNKYPYPPGLWIGMMAVATNTNAIALGTSATVTSNSIALSPDSTAGV